jgi:uncharacterized protein YndB with AHSA1/START domain
MPDIFHTFFVKAPAERVYQCVATPQGLDSWWTKSSAGKPLPDEIYYLGFGADYQWKARVIHAIFNKEFELQITESDVDWNGTRICFVLQEKNGGTEVRFHHTGWHEPNEHYRISCYCWAMYLRLLKRYAEYGEFVPYEDRLDV